MKWTKTEDSFPDGPVLGSYVDGHMNTVYCHVLHSGLDMWYACIDDEDIKAPLYWMPLPTPPQEEK